MKITKKVIFLWAIPIILFTAYLDVLFIGKMNLKQYLITCTWEYIILWTGFFIGEKFTEKRLENQYL
jgi:hypothetical protein